jgi:hypothetical protein
MHFLSILNIILVLHLWRISLIWHIIVATSANFWQINVFCNGSRRHGLKPTNFVHSGTYLQQICNKKIQGLKQKIRKHIGTKMIFKPKFTHKFVRTPVIAFGLTISSFYLILGRYNERIKICIELYVIVSFLLLCFVWHVYENF